MTLVHLRLTEKPQEFMPGSTIVCTFPGKLGDNLARLPIALGVSLRHHMTVDIAVDVGTAPSFLPLVASLPWVHKSFALPGVLHYGCGGQPINFDEPQNEWFHAAGYKTVHHLGYRFYPPGNLTTASATGANLWDITRYPLGVRFGGTVKRILIAPESSREYAAWAVHRTVVKVMPDGVSGPKENLPLWYLGNSGLTHDFAGEVGATRVSDEFTGLLGVARLLCDSLVITTYSAISQLAALVECPCIVLIPPQGINLGHYDSRTPWYPLWRVVTEGDANGLKAAIDEILTLTSESRKEQEP